MHLKKEGRYYKLRVSINGRRIQRSTKCEEYSRAVLAAARIIELETTAGSVGTIRLFRECAEAYYKSISHKRSAIQVSRHIESLNEWIGDLPVQQIHDGTLAAYIANEQKRIKNKSINNALIIVRTVLNKAARSWRNEDGSPWLSAAPLITLLDTTDSHAPYPLDLAELDALLKGLPPHLRRMAEYVVHTGCREQEVCQLEWGWEREVQGVRCFVLPWTHTKNHEPRVVVLNRVATDIVDQMRGGHSRFVFGEVKKMNTPAYQKAWKGAGLPTEGVVHGVHNLRHTFGRRLRALQIPHETRQALLGHSNGSITTHYSQAELQELHSAVEKLCEIRPGVILRAVS